MRSPLLNIFFGLIVAAIGVAMLVFAGFVPRGSGVAGPITFGIALLLGSAPLIYRAVVLANRRAALRAGRGVVQRWRVSAADISAFQRLDAGRGAQFASLINMAPWRGTGDGEVIIGEHEIVVDGAILPLARGFSLLTGGIFSDLAHVGWQPSALEFYRLYGGRSGMRLQTLRVPVPPPAHLQAELVVDHFARELPIAKREALRRQFHLHYQASAGDAAGANIEQKKRDRSDMIATLLIFGAVGLVFGLLTGLKQPPMPVTQIVIVGVGLTSLLAAACLWIGRRSRA